MQDFHYLIISGCIIIVGIVRESNSSRGLQVQNISYLQLSKTIRKFHNETGEFT